MVQALGLLDALEQLFNVDCSEVCLREVKMLQVALLNVTLQKLQNFVFWLLLGPHLIFIQIVFILNWLLGFEELDEAQIQTLQMQVLAFEGGRQEGVQVVFEDEVVPAQVQVEEVLGAIQVCFQVGQDRLLAHEVDVDQRQSLQAGL